MTQQAQYDMLDGAALCAEHELKKAITTLGHVKKYLSELGDEAGEIPFIVGYLKDKLVRVQGIDIAGMVQ